MKLVFFRRVVGLGAFLLFLSVGSIFASGQNEGGSSSDGGAEVVMILKTLSNPFWVEMKNGIEKKAEELGISVDIIATQSEDDMRGQLQLFENLINKNYKAIGFAPLSPVNLITPAVKAYEKGIYLVNIDEQINMTQLKLAGGNVSGFVTADNVEIGGKGATYIIENNPSGGQVAIIEGKAGNPSGEARKIGASKAFKDSSSFELVTSQPADWDRSKALDVAANMIQRYPDLVGIYCANDVMALGVQQAVENAGKADQIMVVGTDGAPEAVDSVKNGYMAATVAQDPATVGAECLQILVDSISEGTQIALDAEPEFVAVPSKLITK